MRTYALLVALAAGLAAPAVAPGAPARAGAGPAVVARYTFDPAGAMADASGRGHTLRVVANNGGTVRSIAHGTGHALAFPARCAARAARTCPHAVLQAAAAADLNPGARPIAYGASVRLTRTQTTGGQNVVQKGYSTTSSQYKLQIDGAAGRPSCVLVDDRKPAIRLVRSGVPVADGRWHTVECRRSGPSFAILVDGATRGAMTVPAALSVTNSGPLSVGGKGAYRDNDKFQGALDDVWVRIG